MLRRRVKENTRAGHPNDWGIGETPAEYCGLSPSFGETAYQRDERSYCSAEESLRSVCRWGVLGVRKVLDCEFVAYFRHHPNHWCIEGYACGIGDSVHPLEVADHCRRIDQARSADTSSDGVTRGWNVSLILQDGIDEGDEFFRGWDSRVDTAAIGDGEQVCIFAVLLTARTEQEGVRGGSEKTLVDSRNP